MTVSLPFLLLSTVMLYPFSLFHTILGSGFPLALHVSDMFRPSLTATVDVELSASTMFGGTVDNIQESHIIFSINLHWRNIRTSEKRASDRIYGRLTSCCSRDQRRIKNLISKGFSDQNILFIIYYQYSKVKFYLNVIKKTLKRISKNKFAEWGEVNHETPSNTPMAGIGNAIGRSSARTTYCNFDSTRLQ